MSLFSVKNNEIYVTYRINSNKSSSNQSPEPIIQAIYFFLYSPTMTTIKAESKTVPTKTIAINVPMIYKTRPLQQVKAESNPVPTPNTHPTPSKPRAMSSKAHFPASSSPSSSPSPSSSSETSATHHFTDTGPRLKYSGSWVDYNLLPDFLRDYCLAKAYEMIEDAGH